MNKAKDLIVEYLNLIREEELTKSEDRMAFRDIKARQDKIKEEIADLLTLEEALKIVNYELQTKEQFIKNCTQCNELSAICSNEDGVYICQKCKNDYQEPEDLFMEVKERKLELEEV